MSNDTVSPFLSIIVPVFNVEKYLERCLDSILKQTFTDFELICVDDGSVDSSTSILEKYARKDNRIKIIKKKNGGLSSARNAGLEIATGEWVLFVDSDDLLGCHGKTNSDELSQLCTHASEDVDWIVAQSTVFYEDGYKHKDESGDLSYFQLPNEGIYHKNQLLNIHMNVCAWGKLYRRSLIEKNHLRFPFGLRYEDEYWYPCYLLVSKNMKVVDVKLYSYLRRNDGIMGDSYEKKNFLKADDRLKIFEQVISFYRRFHISPEIELYLARKFDNLYQSAKHFCPDEDRLYIYWHAGKILRDFDIDCRGDRVLEVLKLGKVEPKPTKLSKLRNSISKRVAKLKALMS